jgi:hypothetical protein
MKIESKASSGVNSFFRRGIVAAMFCLLPFAALAVPGPVSVAAGAALGAEFNATNSPTGFQSRHQVAVDGIGNSVVVWEDNAAGTGGGWSIMGRCFNTSGNAVANSFLISSASASGAQRFPSVARDSSGDFIVAWEDFNGSSTHLGHRIQARWFTGANICNAATAPSPFVVANPGSEVHTPAVALNAVGNAVIFWNDLNVSAIPVITGAGYAKNLTSTSWLATVATTGLRYPPAVAADKLGNFVLAWAQGTSADLDIYLQGFTAGGSTLSASPSPVLVNTTTTGIQDAPSVSMNASGDFVVAWESDVSTKEIQAQRYHLDSVAQSIATQGAELTVILAATSHQQFAPSVAVDYAGNFWTAWQDVDTSGTGVSARWYNAGSTTFDAASTRVNSPDTNSQVLPSAAADTDGDLLVAWTDQGAEGSGDDVFVRRFAGHESVDLSVSTSDAPQPAIAGSALTYTLTVTNNHALVANAGANDASIGTATGIVLTDTLPPSNATFVSASGTNWTCPAPVSGVVTCTYSGTLAPQATATVVVQVTPTAAGNVTNSVLVKGSQFDASFANNSLTDSQSAVAAVYSLSANPTSITFADTNVGSTSAGTSVTITNSGNAPITLSNSDFTAGGTNPTEFGIASGSNNCSGATLAVGGTCTVSFTFMPNTFGNRSATETANTTQSQGTPLVIPVSGKGLGGAISFNPTTLTFSNQDVGTTSLPQPVVLTNSGNASLTITSIGIAGGGYSQTNNCPGFLIASASCEIDVSFTPTGSGSFPASLTVLSSAGSQSVSLSGTGLRLTPDPFTFTPVTGAPLNTGYDSNAVTISGLDQVVSFTVNGGTVSINGGAAVTSGTVQNTDSVVAHVTSASSVNTKTIAILYIGSTRTFFGVTTYIPDTTPTAFSFTPVTNAALSTAYQSNTITISGLEPGYTGTPIRIIGWQYSLNGNPYTSSAGTVKNGDTVAVQVTTASTFSTRVKATLIVGTLSATYSVDTRAADTTPNAFSFTSVSNAEFSTVYPSNATIVSGLEPGYTGTAISITGGQYSLDGGANWTSSPGTTRNGDSVMLRQTSSASHATHTTATVRIGTVYGSFTVTTKI